MQINLRRIKAERVFKKISQAQMAKILGISRTSYAKKEEGITSLSANDLIKIIDALGYSWDKAYIFFDHDVPEKEQVAY